MPRDITNEVSDRMRDMLMYDLGAPRTPYPVPIVAERVVDVTDICTALSEDNAAYLQYGRDSVGEIIAVRWQETGKKLAACAFIETQLLLDGTLFDDISYTRAVQRMGADATQLAFYVYQYIPR